MGGLGNQLFQIFATIAYSIRYSIPFKFEYSETLKVGIERNTYWNNFLKRLKPFTIKENIKLPLYREKGFEYNKIPLIKQSFKLFGYFQSYKYFEDQYEKIIRLIQLRNQQEMCKEKYNNYFINDRNTISLHFRLGDYKEKQQYHPIMSMNHYINSLKYIINKTHKNEWNVLYFCQKEDNKIVEKNISKLSEIYKQLTFIKVTDDITDWEQMLIMSCCNHNIIANSSFSWWGAYFNNNIDKIVCYPNIWFGPAAGKRNMNDLFDSNWIKIH